MAFLSLALVSVGACVAGDNVVPEAPEAPSVPVNLGETGELEDIDVATPAVRELRVSCARELQAPNREILRAQVTTDKGAVFAVAEFTRGADTVTVPLDFRIGKPITLGDGGFTTFSTTEFLSGGNTALDQSPFTCADVAELGVHVTVDFDDGRTICLDGGNPDAPKPQCQ